MHWKKSAYLLLGASILLLQSCVKDKPNPNGGGQSNQNDHPKVFVANEGAFGNGNASLSYIDLDEQKVYNNIYQDKNNKVLGDVLQSIAADEKYLYLVVNNSNKIVIIDKKTFEYQGEIAVTQPRYMIMIGNGKALVSSMYRSRLYIVDLNSRQIESEIPVNFTNTEGMIAHGNKIYIAPWNVNCNYIYQFDKSSMQIEDSIYISGYAPMAMVLDKNEKLWVLAGNPYNNVSSTFTQLNVSNKQILKSIAFSAKAETIKPVMNPAKDIIYFLGVDYDGNANAYNGLFQMSIDDVAAPTQPLLRAQNLQYFWGLGVNPKTGNLFFGDPKGWIQSGTVSELSPDGTLLNTYTLGLGPGYFYFD